jgi:hypothetical protein
MAIEGLPVAQPLPPVKTPANRHYVFAKNCWNSHGRFAIGDRARGAFSDDLVRSYLDAGILKEAPRG